MQQNKTPQIMRAQHGDPEVPVVQNEFAAPKATTPRRRLLTMSGMPDSQQCWTNGTIRTKTFTMTNIPWENVRERMMRHPAVRAEYDRIGPARELAFALADSRRKAGVTRSKVANRPATGQSDTTPEKSGKATRP